LTLDLEQEESITVIQKIKVLPMDREIKISEENNEKLVIRSYYIDVKDSDYPTMNKITIKYKFEGRTEKIKDYAVYLSNGLGDKVYLCRHSSKILNTLFNNIIMLELSNWRRVVQGLEPLKTIKDYKSLMFELDEDDDRRTIRSLEKHIEKNISNFLEKFQNYHNTNKIVPTEVWQIQVS
jgi:hypothetical protein